MTLLTLSPDMWTAAHIVGPFLNIIPALLAGWWCWRMDLKKEYVGPIGLIVYVGVGLVIYYGITALRALEIITVSSTN